MYISVGSPPRIGIAQADDGHSILVLCTSVSSVPTQIDPAGQYEGYFATGEVSEKFARLFPVLTKALARESYILNLTVQGSTLIGGLTSTYEADPAAQRYQNLAGGCVEIFIQEELGSAHSLEDISNFVAG